MSAPHPVYEHLVRVRCQRCTKLCETSAKSDSASWTPGAPPAGLWRVTFLQPGRTNGDHVVMLLCEACVAEVGAPFIPRVLAAWKKEEESYAASVEAQAKRCRACDGVGTVRVSAHDVARTSCPVCKGTGGRQDGGGNV